MQFAIAATFDTLVTIAAGIVIPTGGNIQLKAPAGVNSAKRDRATRCCGGARGPTRVLVLSR